jgi:hypothetical protein
MPSSLANIHVAFQLSAVAWPGLRRRRGAAAATACGYLEPYVRATKSNLSQSTLLWRGLRQDVGRSPAGCLSPFYVDLLSSLCHVSQDGDFVWQDVHKAAVDSKIDLLIANAGAQLAIRQLGDQRYVVGQNAQLAVDARCKNYVDLTAIQFSLWRNNGQC